MCDQRVSPWLICVFIRYRLSNANTHAANNRVTSQLQNWFTHTATRGHENKTKVQRNLNTMSNYRNVYSSERDICTIENMLRNVWIYERVYVCVLCVWFSIHIFANGRKVFLMVKLFCLSMDTITRTKPIGIFICSINCKTFVYFDYLTEINIDSSLTTQRHNTQITHIVLFTKKTTNISNSASFSSGRHFNFTVLYIMFRFFFCYVVQFLLLSFGLGCSGKQWNDSHDD